MHLSLYSDITTFAWASALTAAFVIGLSKAGIKGIAIINVTLMALAFTIFLEVCFLKLRSKPVGASLESGKMK